MARTYNRPPGVVITETTQTNIVPILATPDQICLVGPAEGTVEITEPVQLSGTTATKFKKINDDDVMTSGAIVEVTDFDSTSAKATNPAYDPAVGYESASYTFSHTAHTIARVEAQTPAALAQGIDKDDTTITVANVTAGTDGWPTTGSTVTGVLYIQNTTVNPPIGERIEFEGVATSSTNLVFSNCVRSDSSYEWTTSANNKVTTRLQIPNNRTVYIRYKYTPKDYYQPKRYAASEYSVIEDKYGKPFDEEDGTIVNSPLTLAAKLAIENGASDLVIQPVFNSTDSITTSMTNRSAPDNQQLATQYQNVWAKSFRSLQNEENVGVIVPIVGQSATYNFGTGNPYELKSENVIEIFKVLQQHLSYMYTEYDKSIIAILGEDSTSTPPSGSPELSAGYASRVTLSSHLSQLQSFSNENKSYNEQIVFIAQTEFRRPSTDGPSINARLGGQYAAAAVAGKLASYEPSVSLTRKTLGGFRSVYDLRTKREKTQDSGLGFFVIEQNAINNSIVIRHALTTDTTSVSKSELNVVRAKHYMLASLRQTVDSQIIGQVIADENATTTIVSTIASTLRTLQDDGVIVQFDSVQAQIDSIDPTEIGVRFNYRPAFAINYVNIKFSIDLSSGVTSLTATDQGNIGA